MRTPLPIPPPYDGPPELRISADLLAPIGEVVLAFAHLEQRLTWSIESLLQINKDEADALEEAIRNFSIRLDLFRTIAAPHATTPDLLERLEDIVVRIGEANAYRNNLLHGRWVAVTIIFSPEGKFPSATNARSPLPKDKGKLAKRREHSALEVREKASYMFDLCKDIRIWINETCPNARPITHPGLR